MKRVRKEKSKKSKKKFIIIVIAVIIVIAIVFFIYSKVKSNNISDENKVAVQSVGVITGANNTSQNRFSGVVVSQKTVKLQKTEGRTIKKVYVEVGQAVKTGDKLFEYDTEDTTTKIEQANLEVEKMQNSITNTRKQIDTINAEKNANPGGDHSSFNIEIQSLENEIKQTEYSIKEKKAEIDKLKKSLKNVVITSEIDGIVQSIKDTETEQNNMANMGGNTENDGSYMTIMQTGQYRIKGTVNEQNMFSINVGDKVLIHSRVDDKITWTGTIDNIDTSNPENNSNNFGYMMPGDDSNKSSKYPFYIALDSMDGLMIGQHVYIEKNVGQGEKRDGLWLSSFYIFEENGENYVWASNKNDKLEKRKIKVGEKNEEIGEYQILEGLSNEDYIAIPQEGLQEGSLVNKFDTTMIPSDEEIMMDEGSSTPIEGEVAPVEGETPQIQGTEDGTMTKEVTAK